MEEKCFIQYPNLDVFMPQAKLFIDGILWMSRVSWNEPANQPPQALLSISQLKIIYMERKTNNYTLYKVIANSESLIDP